jgi:hypothetical protein
MSLFFLIHVLHIKLYLIFNVNIPKVVARFRAFSLYIVDKKNKRSIVTKIKKTIGGNLIGLHCISYSFN